MRRILLVSGAFLFAIAAFVSAQTTGLKSLQSKSSYGVFTNELDGAVSAYQSSSGPSFNDLKNSYLFGGISNLNNVLNKSTNAFGANSPLWLGYFHSGNLPWSLFLGLSQYSTTAVNSGTATSTTNTPGTAVTAGTTTYNWTANSATTTENIPLFNELSEQGQFLTTFKGINGGLYAKTDLIDKSAPGTTVGTTNFTTTTTYNYNSAATGAAPAPKTDYTKTVKSTALAINNTYTFKVPLFMQTGIVGNGLLLSGTFNSQDNSTGTSTTFSAPPADPTTAASNFINTTGGNGATPDTTNKTGSNKYGLEYTATLPFLSNIDSMNQAFVGVNGTLTTYSADFGTSYSSQQFNYTGGGSQSTTPGPYSSTNATYAFSTPVDYSVTGTFGQRLYFNLGSSTQFGLVPNLAISYSTNHNNSTINAYPYQVSSVTTVSGSSSTGNTSFAANGDTKTTTVDSYTNGTLNPSTGNIVAQVSQNVFSTTLSVPVALKFQPKGWVFGITLGDEPQLSYTNTKTITGASTYDTSTTNATTGGSTSTSKTTGQITGAGATSTGNTSQAHSWSVTENHSIGGEIDISKDVKVSIDFTGTSGTGIWDFNNMTVQGIVALK